MTKAGDSFVAEDFFRLHRGDLALWTTASLIVVAGLIGGYWAYKTYVPAEVLSGPPAGAMTVEFAEFAVSPVTEELDVPEGEASAASEEVAPSEAEPDPEAEPIEEPEPVVEAEPEEVVEPEPVVEPEFVEPQEVTETAEAETLPEPEPVVEPTSEPEPVEEAVPEPVEPILDVPEVEVPEPPVVIERRVAAAEPVEPPEPEPVLEPPVVEPPVVEPEPLPEPEPAPEEPVVEPVDPTLPMPVAMPQRVADIRAETPPTKFEPPVRRTAPPPQAATQAAAPRPAAQQAAQAAAPQQAPSAEPSASQVNRWESSVLRHIGQRRRYPAAAERRGETGRVVVQFTINAAGQVQSVSIAGSSGFASLDDAARDLVYASSPVPRPPEGIAGSRLTIAMPIDYERNR